MRGLGLEIGPEEIEPAVIELVEIGRVIEPEETE